MFLSKKPLLYTATQKERFLILIIKTLFLGRRIILTRPLLHNGRTYCLRHGFTTFNTIPYHICLVNTFIHFYNTFFILSSPD